MDFNYLHDIVLKQNTISFFFVKSNKNILFKFRMVFVIFCAFFEKKKKERKRERKKEKKINLNLFINSK